MDSGVHGAITRPAERLGRWAAVAIGFSIPISVALDNVLIAAVLAAWLLGARYRDKFRSIGANLTALAALALFALLLLGTAHGERYPGDAVGYLAKYADLVLLPVLIWSFRNGATRLQGIYALAAGLATVLLLSYLIHFGIVPPMKQAMVDPETPIVFKYRLTHNILMAYAAFLFVGLAHASASLRWRWIWLVLALLAACNVMLMVGGRTGQLILCVLVLYGGYAWKGWRGLSLGIMGVVVLAAALTAIPGPVQTRVKQGWSELSAWRPDAPRDGSSVGDRLSYHFTSLQIIRDRPLLGSGTGSFPRAYAEKTQGTKSSASRNPHNEFLLIAVQTGLVGLGVFVFLLAAQWRLAPRLATALEAHLARALVLTMVTGCLFNSLLLDHTEGLLYVWLTAVLYGGLKSPESEKQGTAA